MALLYGLCEVLHFPFLKMLILFSDTWHSELLLVFWYDFSGIYGKKMARKFDYNDFWGKLSP